MTTDNKLLRVRVELAFTEQQAIAMCEEAMRVAHRVNPTGNRPWTSGRDPETGFPQWTDSDRKEAIRFLVHQLVKKVLDTYPAAKIGV